MFHEKTVFAIAKFRILKGLKVKKNNGLLPIGKIVTGVLIFGAANTFFSVESGISHRQWHRCLFRSPFLKTQFKPIFSLGQHFLISYTFVANWYASTSVP